MAKKIKPLIPEVILTPEEKFDKALHLMECSKQVGDFTWRLFFMRKAIALMDEIKADVPAAKKELAGFHRERSQCRVEQRVYYYSKAKEIMDKANSIADYEKALEYLNTLAELEKKPPIRLNLISEESAKILADIPEASVAIKECQLNIKKLQRKDNARFRRRISILVLLIAALLLFSRTSLARQLVGSAAEKAGQYKIAMQAYHSAYVRGGKDANETKSIQNKYAYADSLYDEGSYAAAQSLFRSLSEKDYEDSKARMLECEKQMLKNAEVGTKVTFAKVPWLVLDKDDEGILLYRVRALIGKELVYDEEDTTWETSAMRSYLNSDYINGAFLPEEADMIIPQTIHTEDNSVYFTEGGNDTTDRIFLLSADELEKYKDIMYTTKTGFYLRTPGANPCSFAYAATDLSTMYYGYEEGSKLLRLKPVMKVTFGD